MLLENERGQTSRVTADSEDERNLKELLALDYEPRSCVVCLLWPSSSMFLWSFTYTSQYTLEAIIVELQHPARVPLATGES